MLTIGNTPIEGDLFNWNTSGLNGLYTLRLKATDVNGRIKSDEVNVDIVNQVYQSNNFIVYGNTSGIFQMDYNSVNGFENKSLVGYPSYGNLNGIAIADFDNDGDHDFVTGYAWETGWGPGYRHKNGYINIYFNDGQDNYSEGEILFHEIIFCGNLFDFAVGDFNNDGWMDFVMSSSKTYPY